MKKYLILSLFCVVSPFVSVDAMEVERGSDRQSMKQELKKFQRIRPELKKMVAEEERKGTNLAKERADLEVDSAKLAYIGEVYSDLSDSLERLQLESLYLNFKKDLDESLRGRNEEEDKAVVTEKRLLSTALSIDLYKCMFDLMREGFTQTVKGQVNALLGHAGSLLDGAAYKAFSEVGWLEEQLNDVRTAKAELQTELDDAKAALEKKSNANNANDALQEQLDDAKAALEKESTANAELRSQFEAANAKLKQRLESANDALQEQRAAKAELEQQLESAKAELQEQCNAKAELEQQLESANAELKKKRNANNANAALEQQLESAKAELQEQRTAKAELEQQLESAKAELQEQCNAKAELEQQLESANAALEKKRAENVGLRSELDDANAKLEQQSNANNANDALQEQLDDAKAELEKQRNAKAELQKQLDHAKEVDAKVREKLLLIGEENKQVEAKIAGLEKQAELLPSLIAVSQSVIREFITAKNAPLTENEKAKLRQFVSIIERLQQLTGQQIAAGLGSINPIAFDSSEGGK